MTDDAPPETPQVSLPINNTPENKISNDDLDLSYWGGVVERAKRAARSGDSQTLSIITVLLQSAMDAIKGAKTSPVSNNVTVNGGNNNLTDFMNTKI